MKPRDIEIQDAREHNLKGINISIPREKLVVITGPSGSGKSSLAKDILYAEGHRRYVSCLSSEARQSLQQIKKPAVDSIKGLPPAIYIDQKASSRNPRSTVGTATEIYELLRLLFAKIGVPFCHACGQPIVAQSLEQMTDRLMDLPEKTRLIILAPLAHQAVRKLPKILEHLGRQGFLRIRIDGKVFELEDANITKRKDYSTLDVVIDRLVIRAGIRSRLSDSIEIASGLSEGLVKAWIEPESENEKEWLFSEQALCSHCGASFPEINPQLFSFNSPHGACSTCSGLGKLPEVDVDRVVPDQELSLTEGAIHAWRGRPQSYVQQVFECLARHAGFDLFTPYKKLSSQAKKLILYGSGQEKIPFHFQEASGQRELHRPFEGVIPNMQRRYRETDSEKVRHNIKAYMTVQACPDCNGARLRREALCVRIDEKNIAELTSMDILTLKQFFSSLHLSEFHRAVVGQAATQILERLSFLCDLGLEYLSLDREAQSLSGGEAQRIQLASHIGTGLVGVLYILDEPTLGLHPRDTGRLLKLLEKLRDRGNTVLVVEHDEQTMLAADHLIDMGPGAGVNGGEIIFYGPPGDLKTALESTTGQYLLGSKTIPVPRKRRSPRHGFLTIKEVTQHNLKAVTARIPVSLLTCVTGVSGSGKSSLVLDALYPTLTFRLYGAKSPASKSNKSKNPLPRLDGLEFFDKVITVTQTPLSRSPRSNPATYIGLLSMLRDLFAQLPESRQRGYSPSRFSFNVKGGRCEVCQGEGLRKIELHFLPDVYVTCDLCKGAKYNRETLEIRFRGRNIAEILTMTVQEALTFFDAHPQLHRRLEILTEVGLGYLQLGQPATTLSGGEAQRVKLARELCKSTTGRTLYIMDEPTTGLHFVDIEKLLLVLKRLTEAGNTILIIEHNLEVIKTADWIIDLGPEAGEMGGHIIAEGPPEEIAATADSHTGRFLAKALGKKK